MENGQSHRYNGPSPLSDYANEASMNMLKHPHPLLTSVYIMDEF